MAKQPWGIDSSRSSNLPSNFPLSEDEHLLARKLFFKLSDESLLDLVEFHQEAQRHENHNRTQSWTDFDLLEEVNNNRTSWIGTSFAVLRYNFWRTGRRLVLLTSRSYKA